LVNRSKAESSANEVAARRLFVIAAYSLNFTDLYRRAATYVEKILKGSKPANLPVQQPTKFELVISLKAAKQIDLTIPPNVLAKSRPNHSVIADFNPKTRIHRATSLQ
jgi:hypothetical protein